MFRIALGAAVVAMEKSEWEWEWEWVPGTGTLDAPV
jgi:hypothetical protein